MFESVPKQESRFPWWLVALGVIAAGIIGIALHLRGVI